MDFVTAWKASSIVLTGAFGVLGLTKDYKNKETGKFTAWGKVSLAGVLLSSGLGVAAQLKESSDQEKVKAVTSAQTLLLAQNTDKAVKDIQRMLSPLDDPRVFMNFDLDCTNPQLKQFCSDVIHDKPGFQMYEDIQQQHWSHWPSTDDWLLDPEVHFFIDPKDADRFETPEIPTPKGDLLIKVEAHSHASAREIRVFTNGKDRVGITYSGDNPSMFKIVNNGRLQSLLDLPGVTVVISGDTVDFLTPTHFMLTLKNGRSISYDGPFMKGKAGPFHDTAYRFAIPTFK
jgi:hypothetical protein